MNTPQKAVMKQALEALETIRRVEDLEYGSLAKSGKAVAALRAAIAQPESEPVAWMVYFDARLGGARITDKLLVWTEKAAKEQVKEDLIQKIVPLYAAPGADYVPLSDEQIDLCMAEAYKTVKHGRDLERHFARAIERAVRGAK